MRWLAITVALALVAAAILASRSKSETPKQTCADAPTQLLPEWARTGFTDPEPKMPLVLGKDQEIAAIVFGSPLYEPPKADRSNKILWVSREPLKGSSDLKIRATRVGDAKVAERTVPGGPGPSLIDLPEGCWKLQLSWSGHTDELDLRYRGAD
jgi:hypothetical protein